MQPYPKIHALGTRYISDIWDGPVEITEKIDGSQFKFAVGDDGETFRFRSRNGEIYPGACANLFMPAVAHIQQQKLTVGFIYYGETLAKPKHNALTYNRVPRGHIALFGVYDAVCEKWLSHERLRAVADNLDIDVVPQYTFNDIEDLIRGVSETDSLPWRC